MSGFSRTVIDRRFPMRATLSYSAVALIIMTTSPSGQAPARAAQAQPAAAQPVIRQLMLYDRQGNKTATLGKPAVYTQPVFSPDGSRIAVILGGDVWIFDLAKGTGTQITSTPEGENAPVWLRDGTQIAYRATRGNVTAVYRNTTTGTPSEQRVAPVSLTLTDWSNDARFLLGHFGGAQDATKGDLFFVPLTGNVKLISVLATPADEIGARLSFNGSLIAYRSDAVTEPGTFEIYVRPFSAGATSQPSVGQPVQVSNNGGLTVRWGKDDKELYYLARDGSVMAAAINPKPVKAGAVTKLFQVPSAFPLTAPPGGLMDISSDGQRFALLIPAK
jgi:hypothetical protein